VARMLIMLQVSQLVSKEPKRGVLAMSWFDQSQQSNPYSTLVSVTGPIASSPVSGPISDTQPSMYIPVQSPTNYVLPDERALSRTNFQHMMLRTALGGNYLAPVEDPRYILDVGCGSGRWAYELAERFVQARVVGVDLTPPSNYADISGV